MYQSAVYYSTVYHSALYGERSVYSAATASLGKEVPCITGLAVKLTRLVTRASAPDVNEILNP